MKKAARGGFWCSGEAGYSCWAARSQPVPSIEKRKPDAEKPKEEQDATTVKPPIQTGVIAKPPIALGVKDARQNQTPAANQEQAKSGVPSIVSGEGVIAREGVDTWFYKLIHDPIAGFTLVLAVGTFLLWWATRRLVLDARDTAKRQLRAYINVFKAYAMPSDGIESGHGSFIACKDGDKAT